MAVREVVVPPLGPVIGFADELYLSFAECPHDVLPAGYKDGDDSIHAGAHAVAHQQALTAPIPLVQRPTVKAGPRRVIVPHPRDLKRNMAGSDVLALQRALAAHHLRKWGTFTFTDGAGTVEEVKELQHAAGYKVTGVYDEAAHRLLAPFYDAYGISLLTGWAARSAVNKRQQQILAAAMVTYNYRDLLHYTQGALRWYLIANHVRHQAVPSLRAGYGDCSAFATWLYWDCGAPDPNELNFAGGYTGTLGVHGEIVANPAKATVGVMFLYGPGTHDHVQVSVGGENTIGFGDEIGPLYLPADYRGDLNVVRKYPGLSL